MKRQGCLSDLTVRPERIGIERLAESRAVKDGRSLRQDVLFARARPLDSVGGRATRAPSNSAQDERMEMRYGESPQAKS